MRAYSQDLRQRILHAVDQGKSRAEIVKIFEISRATIKRYLKLRRETGEVRAKAIPGRPAKKGAVLQVGLRAQVEAYPDATLQEHCELWEAEYGMHVSTATMSRAIQRGGWTRKKKTLRASERKEEARTAWREQAQTFDISKLVFVDVSSATTLSAHLTTHSTLPFHLYRR